MNDYLEILRHHKKEDKEIVDLIDDVQKLRYYYSAQQYDSMLQHINTLMLKYSFEAIVWNAVNSIPPTSYHQAYQNAENFLKSKGIDMLIKKGYQVAQN